jgi:hypothetical protein
MIKTADINGSAGTIKDSFVGHIFLGFQRYCLEKEESPDVMNLLRYLLRYRIFDTKTIRHFTILMEYRAMEEMDRYRNKTTAIQVIARKFGVHENTVWNILKDHDRKFDPDPAPGKGEMKTAKAW